MISPAEEKMNNSELLDEITYIRVIANKEVAEALPSFWCPESI